jgi:hypothetical protein
MISTFKIAELTGKHHDEVMTKVKGILGKDHRKYGRFLLDSGQTFYVIPKELITVDPVQFPDMSTVLNDQTNLNTELEEYKQRVIYLKKELDGARKKLEALVNTILTNETIMIRIERSKKYAEKANGESKSWT